MKQRVNSQFAKEIVAVISLTNDFFFNDSFNQLFAQGNSVSQSVQILS